MERGGRTMEWRLYGWPSVDDLPMNRMTLARHAARAAMAP
jgi:hypothetical protein